MTHKITDECVACGTCADECPVEAITEGESIYSIDPGSCTDCGSCLNACPIDAIVEGN